MARTHLRKAVLAAVALVAATTLLTACDGDDVAATEPAASGTATAAPAAKEKPAANEQPATGKGADEGDTTAGSGADEGDTTAGSGADEGDTTAGSGNGEGDVTAGKGKGVSGTWFGNVSYIAPGKYSVSDMKGTEQMFWVAEDTDIQGAGDICGDENGQAATPCTEAELEAAAKKGVSAEVKIEGGVAVSVVDDH
ncbi:hypothetical protein [Streptomyces liangshanensis]|uniref:Lipoprotein n=1 Tax=Streptomyces liangshanensis TaxID=2717324 RepID=A0A6G9GZN6_9ACTN|nr:hypothetical protein [Streptomyces liangshanensis]QIQ03684.1 hypothetical protein HA039_16345 [Streptomyces liangshanensis]